MKRRSSPSLYSSVFFVALACLGAGCALTPEAKTQGGGAPVKVEDVHADKVEKAATAALGHDRFSVCFVESGAAGIATDMSLQSLTGFGGPTTLVKGMAAGLADNQKRGLDVVVDGKDPARSDRVVRSALEELKMPLPGLDLVLLSPPSPGLQAVAQKYDVVLHTITLD